LTNPKEKISYALGMDIIATLQRQGAEVDTKALASGMADTLAGNGKLTSEQQKAALEILSKSMMTNSAARMKVAAARNLQAGQAFLEANLLKPGVNVIQVTAPDGASAQLQYQILQTGTGPSPQKDDLVDVRYVGSLIDGTVFDSSIKRNLPATIGLDQVIPGWSAALQEMKAGDKWRLFIPPALAYGSSGFLKIPPGSTLIFDLELLSFHSPHQTNSAPATEALPRP